MSRFWLAALALLLSGLTAASGQFSLDTPIVTHRLLDGWRIPNGPDSRHMAGVQITLGEGWKTYWRSPGEFGLAPMLEVRNAANVRRVKIHFPKPSIFHHDGIRTIGYADEVVFPLEVTVTDPNAVASMNALLHIGVCSNVCVPIQLDMPLRLLPERNSLDHMILNWLASGPTKIHTTGRGEIATCEISPTRSAHSFLIDYEFAYPGTIDVGSAAIFELPGDAASFSDAALERIGSERVKATSVMTFLPRRPISISRQELTMTLMSGEDYVEFVGCHDPQG